MEKGKRATEAAPICQTQSKDIEYQSNVQEISTKEPLHISKAIQETANMERCSRSGEVSLMAIISKRMKGGNYGA